MKWGFVKMKLTLTERVAGYEDVMDDKGSIVDIDHSDEKFVKTLYIESGLYAVTLHDDDIKQLSAFIRENGL